METIFISAEEYNDFKGTNLAIADGYEWTDDKQQRPLTVSEYLQAFDLYKAFRTDFDFSNMNLEQARDYLHHISGCVIRNYEPHGYLDIEYSSDNFKAVEYILVTLTETESGKVSISSYIDTAIRGLDYEYECMDTQEPIMYVLK